MCITLDCIKGTWIEPRITSILNVSSVPLNEGQTYCVSEIPSVLKKPVERGGVTINPVSILR